MMLLVALQLLILGSGMDGADVQEPHIGLDRIGSFK